MEAIFKENDSELDVLYNAVANAKTKVCTAADTKEECKIKFDVVFNRPNNYKPKEII